MARANDSRNYVFYTMSKKSKKTIISTDANGRRHGYQQDYWDGKLSYRAMCNNGNKNGYAEWHSFCISEYFIS